MTPIDADLGQLVDVIRGITFPTDANRRQPGPGLVACLRTTNVQGSVDWDDLLYVDENHVKSADQFVRNGDILVSMSNSLELVGKCALVTDVPQRAAFGAFIAVVRVRDGVNPTYVFHAMRSPRFRAYVREAASTTTNISNINASKLIAAPIPLFGPATCTSIASKLDELFSRVDDGERALERVQKLVERYRQSVLKAAVTGELTRDWREKNKHKHESGDALLARILKARREAWEKAELDKMKAKGITPANDKWKQKYEEPAAPDTAGLPELPLGWSWASLDQLSQRVTDGTHQSPDFTASGVPFLTIQHVSPGVIRWDDVNKWVAHPTYLEHTKSMRPQRSDVLYTAVASYGMAVAIDTDMPFMFQRHIAHIRPLVEMVNPKYLEAALNSPLTLSLAHRVARGVAQKTVTLGDLRMFPIPVAPFSEQSEVIDEIALEESRLLEVVNPSSDFARMSAALRQSVLKAAFAGGLVNQDSADESAATLLSRITAERHSTAATPRRGYKTKNQEPA